MRYWVFILLVFSLLTGCNNQAKNGTSPSPQHKHEVRVKQTDPQKPKIKNATQVSNRLEKLAERIPEVKSAKCVVIGNTAVVGINVNSNLDRSRVGTIKYSVAEALRKDRYGKYAIVTADVDLAQRISEIRDDIRRGRPIAGFAEEMADIIGRITPQLPKNINPNGNPPAKTEDRKRLNRPNL